MRNIYLFTIVILIGLLYSTVFAGGNDESYYIPRINGSIKLDGLSNEPGWEAIEPLPLTMYQPTFGGTPTERTEIRIAYDDEYIYFSGRFFDSDPPSIRANSMYRDRYSNDDVFSIVLDTYNDNENALWFMTTPNGIRLDAAVSNDAEGRGRSWSNMNWNTFWDAATIQNEEGWFVEVRIPFSSLRFQDNDGHVEMGLIVNRFIARKNERVIFPAIEPNWSNGQFKPSQAQKIVLEKVYSEKPVYMTPYTLGGSERF